MVSWLLIGFIAYNIAGVIYNIKKHNLKGQQALPHIDKWKEAPGKLKSIMQTTIDKTMMGLALTRGFINRKI